MNNRPKPIYTSPFDFRRYSFGVRQIDTYVEYPCYAEVVHHAITPYSSIPVMSSPYYRPFKAFENSVPTSPGPDARFLTNEQIAAEQKAKDDRKKAELAAQMAHDERLAMRAAATEARQRRQNTPPPPPPPNIVFRVLMSIWVAVTTVLQFCAALASSAWLGPMCAAYSDRKKRFDDWTYEKHYRFRIRKLKWENRLKYVVEESPMWALKGVLIYIAFKILWRIICEIAICIDLIHNGY